VELEVVVELVGDELQAPCFQLLISNFPDGILRARPSCPS
jgi:hypothetical protein